MKKDPRLTELYAWSRIGLAAALVVRPRAAKPWLGDVAGEADAASALRVLGVRDGLLGAAVLLMPAGSLARRRALLLCAAADLADTVVSTTDFIRTKRPGAGLAALTAATGAVVGFLTSRPKRHAGLLTVVSHRGSSTGVGELLRRVA